VFPLLVTLVVRYVFVRFILRGAHSIGPRAKLRRRMDEADREYEADRAARHGAGARGGPAPAPNAEEERYQG
jgi:hypothetical protein